jgi:signal peptidase I
MSNAVVLAGGFVALLVVALALLVVVLRRRFVAVEVSGVSMWPTYAPGDRVLVRRVASRELSRGQVVVFESARPGGWPAGPLPAPRGTTWAIKRVAALPGDPVPADVLRAVAADAGATVPEGSLVVLGDGTDSADSRMWGYVPADRILGVVVRGLSSGRSAAASPGEPGPSSPLS